MKLLLTTTQSSYFTKEAERLKPLGFTFEPTDSMHGEFMIRGMPEIELNSIQQLINFSKKWGDLVISHDPPSIEIYNDYRE